MLGPRPATKGQLIARTIVLKAMAPWSLELRTGRIPLYPTFVDRLEVLIQAAAEEDISADAHQILDFVVDDLISSISTPRLGSGNTVRQLGAAVKREADQYGLSRRNPFEELFQQVLLHARSLYGKYASWQGGATQFELQTAGDHLRPGVGRFPIRAWTDPPGGTGEDSKVNLKLSAHELDLETLAAVPYVLSHETICHAGQGNGEAANLNLFTEGWMDFVAERLISKEDITRSLSWTFLPYEYRRASHALIEEVLCSHQSGTKNWGERSRGRRFAAELLDLLTRLPPIELSPEDRFYRLSTMLNASSLSASTLDQFAQDVGEILLAAKLSVLGIERIPLVDFLRRWESGEVSLQELVQAVRQSSIQLPNE